MLSCVNVPNCLYPFFSWRTSRFWLLLIKLQWTQLSKSLFSMMEYPLNLYSRVLYLGLEVYWFPIFWGTPHWFPQWLYKCVILPAWRNVPLAPHPCHYELSLVLLMLAIQSLVCIFMLGWFFLPHIFIQTTEPSKLWFSWFSSVFAYEVPIMLIVDN